MVITDPTAAPPAPSRRGGSGRRPRPLRSTSPGRRAAAPTSDPAPPTDGPGSPPVDRSAVRAVVRLLGKVLSALAMLAAIALLATVAIPVLGGHRSVIVLSGSMAPAYPRGALVVMQPLAPEDVRLGDVVMLPPVRPGAPPLMHRVVAVSRTGGQTEVRTKGDANPEPDVRAVVLRERTHTPVFSVPLLGFLIGSARTPIGWLALIVIPGAYVTGRAMSSVWRR